MQKEFWFYLQWFVHNYSSKLLINVKENQKKGDNSGKKHFVKKWIFGISSHGYSDRKYVIVTILWSKLWRAVPEQTDRLTDRRTDRKVKTEGSKIMFIASRLRLTLIIGGPIDTITRIMYWKLQEKITKIAIFQQKNFFFEKFKKPYLDRKIGHQIC